VTVTLEVEEPVVEVLPAHGPVATWAARAGAFCIDVVFPVSAMVVLLLVAWSAPARGWLWWLCLVVAAVVLLAVLLNRLLLPAATGWSLGRSVFGIAVRDRDGASPGPWRLLLRDVAHVLDTVPLLLGWLWPLLDSRGRTFADLLVRTEVHQVEGSRPDRRRVAAAVIAASALLATVAAGLAYLGIYRPESSTARARAEIAVQGPKIVSELLTYRAASLQDDFTNAQSLVTEDYRPTWVAQQEAIRKAGAVDNEYWATNSAVLKSSEDRAQMLLLLQGQRGSAGQQRFITASVRVDFERSAPGQWLVSNLSVLAAPGGGGG